MCTHAAAALAVRKCPFLAQLAQDQGESFAQSIALAPLERVGSAPLPASGQEAITKLAESFVLFHGPAGLVPLATGQPRSRASAAADIGGGPPTSGCPFHAQVQVLAAAQAASSSSSSCAHGAPAAGRQQAPSAPSSNSTSISRARLPVATISLSNFGKGPNFGDFLRNQLNKQNNKNSSNRAGGKPGRRPAGSHQPQPRPKGPAGPASSSTGGPHGSGPLSTGSAQPQRPLPGPCSGSGAVGKVGPAAASTAAGGCPAHGGHGLKPPGAAAAAGSSASSPAAAPGGCAASSSSGAGSWASGTHSPASSSSSSSQAPGRGPAPLRQPRPGAGGSRQPGGAGRSRGVAGSSRGAAAAQPPSSSCPLRRWLGPMSGLIFNQYDKLVCPAPIMAARAALARTAPVQQLRPQALPVKLLAVAAVVAGLNTPCGAVREHFEKFSLGWFIAVHATIPFVAMLRKAVVMPPYAIAVTIAAAVVGQAAGARLERARLQHELQHGPILVMPPALQPPLSAVMAAAAAAVSPGTTRGDDGAGHHQQRQERQRRRPAATGDGSRSGESAAVSSSRRGRLPGRELQDKEGRPTGAETAGTNCRSSSSQHGLGAAVLAHLPIVRA